MSLERPSQCLLLRNVKNVYTGTIHLPAPFTYPEMLRMFTPAPFTYPIVLIAAVLAGCAGNKPEPDTEHVIIAEIELAQENESSGAEQIPAAEMNEEPDEVPFLDKAQQTVFGITSGAAQKIDNFFGSSDVEEEATVTRGRLSVGGQWDERDGLKQRLRLKVRLALPAISDRTSLIFGRGETDALVDGSGDDNIDSLPTRFNDFEDEDWLLGIGYTRDKEFKRGWMFGAGVKLATPLEPFVRATYRWNRVFRDDWLWRVEPRLFLQSQRGAGASIQNTLDHAVNDRWLIRSWSVAVVEEEVEGVSWTSKLIAYQQLSRKSAFSYAVFGAGETDYEVPIRDYGIELRYRRQILRDWFFVELLTYLNWPRDFLIEERASNVGLGIEFEMQFGKWPGRRRPSR